MNIRLTALLTAMFAVNASGCFLEHHVGDGGGASQDAGIGDQAMPGQGADTSDLALPSPTDIGLVGVTGGTIVAAGSGYGMAITADDSSLYWLSYTQCGPGCTGSARLLTMPKSGGTPISLLTIAPALYNLALDDAYVYLAHQGSEILRVPKAGGTAQVVASGIDHPFALDVDDSYAYWSTGRTPGGVIYRALKDGSGAQETIVPSVDNPWDLKVDGTTLYYSEMDHGRIMSVPKSGGTPQVLASGWVGTGKLALDVSNVYFLACPTGPCTEIVVMSVPKAGGAAQQLAADDGDTGGGGIVVGPNRVFWSRPISNGWGVVHSIVKTGGSVVEIAGDPNAPVDVAVDANEAAVYWIDQSVSNIGRAALH